MKRELIQEVWTARVARGMGIGVVFVMVSLAMAMGVGATAIVTVEPVASETAVGSVPTTIGTVASISKRSEPKVAEVPIRSVVESVNKTQFIGGDNLEPVSVSIQKGNLAEVVRGIAKSAGLQVYGADSLQGEVTVEEVAIDPLVLLERLSREKQFFFRREGQIIWVSGAGVEGLKGREVYVIKPQYLRVDRLASAFTGIVSKEAVHVLAEENALVVYATPLQRKALAEIQAAIDKKPLQVHLQVQVLARERGTVADRGITWNFGRLTEGVVQGKDGGGSLRIGSLQGREYHLPLDGNVSLQDSHLMSMVVAQPSIQTVSGREASILIGDRVPVIIESVKNGVSSQSVSYQNTGIMLKYTPYVTASNMVDADVVAEVSSPALVPEMKAYRITTREAHTRVRIASGQTMVIGGLLDTRGDTHSQRVPFLSDIPLLGALFKHARKAKQSVELYILLTATVVRDEDETFSKGIEELQREGTVGQFVNGKGSK